MANELRFFRDLFVCLFFFSAEINEGNIKINHFDSKEMPEEKNVVSFLYFTAIYQR